MKKEKKQNTDEHPWFQRDERCTSLCCHVWFSVSDVCSCVCGHAMTRGDITMWKYI